MPSILFYHSILFDVVSGNFNPGIRYPIHDKEDSFEQFLLNEMKLNMSRKITMGMITKVFTLIIKRIKKESFPLGENKKKKILIRKN